MELWMECHHLPHSLSFDVKWEYVIISLPVFAELTPVSRLFFS